MSNMDSTHTFEDVKHKKDCREEFEKWAAQFFLSVDFARADDGYAQAWLSAHWACWQAAWEVRGKCE